MGSEFVSLEAASGIILLLGAAAALIWANADTAGYASWWGRTLTLGSGDFAITETLVHWVNDALMTIFFFVVGLEIKRELVTGELRDTRRAALPAVAAIGGMVVPALIYVLLNLGGAGLDGWAIPMATDIAFAVGVLAILGARVPSSLKLFLLTLAIVDDIGAILVIALFYSSGVEPLWLLGGIAVVGLVSVMSRLGVDRPLAYVIPGALLWLCLYEAGIEPTLAGVVLGLLTPALPRRGRPVLERLESGLHPVSSFVIVPVFALANAGVVLTGDAIDHALASRVTVGIVAGLVVGKFVGISGATLLAVRLRIGRLPDDLGLAHLFGVATLGGIGFTVSLFITDLAFRGQVIDDAKIGVLAASALAAVIGVVVLRIVLRDQSLKETG
ncbi:MAG TPA: Na+/H+ antiporter NhaA [Acidimicrobiia bacterium]|nr:Na+/H+ antiporter NhaA [Acidimicrobiia bacterium]